jgi:hypothetical protein
MQGNARTLSEAAAGLAKLVALALSLAIVVSAGRVAIAVVVVDATRDRTAADAAVTQLAYRHATSQAVTSNPVPEQWDGL